MPEITTFTPGAFCWAEVATTDADRAKAFYTELFGWKFEDRPAGEFGTYTLCQLQKKDLAGLCEMPPSLQESGVPPHWMSYVGVADADAASAKIKQHGGKIVQGPFDVMDAGRMAVCQDPTGASFSIWQPRKHKGTALMGVNGTPCWFELATRGVDKAAKFYADVFGWTYHQHDKGFVYREISAAKSPTPMGGMMELQPEHGPMPPSWTIYFTVDDCDNDCKRAQRLGGKVLVGPMDIEHVGRFAVLADPTGAAFAVIKLSMQHCADHGAPPKATAAPSKAAAAPPPAPAKKPAAPPAKDAKKKG